MKKSNKRNMQKLIIHKSKKLVNFFEIPTSKNFILLIFFFVRKKKIKKHEN